MDQDFLDIEFFEFLSFTNIYFFPTPKMENINHNAFHPCGIFIRAEPESGGATGLHSTREIRYRRGTL